MKIQGCKVKHICPTNLWFLEHFFQKKPVTSKLAHSEERDEADSSDLHNLGSTTDVVSEGSSSIRKSPPPASLGPQRLCYLKNWVP